VIDHEITELPSGLRVVTQTVPAALSVSVGVWVGVGARDEPASLSGVSHFLEHLLFKGTARRTAKALACEIDRVGGDMNAFTTKEFTAYYCRVPERQLGLALDVLGDVLTSPSLRSDDVEAERHVILEELAMDDDAPDDTAYRLLAAALFGEHPLGRETAGDPDTVAVITPNEVRDFFEQQYRAGSMVLAVAGPGSHQTVVDRVADHFAGLRPGRSTLARHTPSPLPTQFVVGERREIEQVHLLFARRGLDRFDPDREALDVVTHVLGGGPSSRLFQTIREERGLAYSTYAGSSAYADAGAFTTYAATTQDHAQDVAELMGAEWDRLVADGITADELADATGSLAGSYAMGFEGTGARADRLGGLLTCYGEIRPIEDQIARWGDVTMADVDRVISRVLDGPRVTCSVGPVDPAALAET
jgi:predicted Zn-dependent peptidase